jgi:hypothetical protein
MAEVILKQNEMIERIGDENLAELEEKMKTMQEITVPPVRKLKKKLVLQNFQPREDTPIVEESKLEEVTTLEPTGEPIVIKVKRRK